MSYGLHAGKRYKDVPTQYLQWVTRSAFKGQGRAQGGDAARVRWAKDELKRRFEEYVKNHKIANQQI